MGSILAASVFGFALISQGQDVAIEHGHNAPVAPPPSLAKPSLLPSPAPTSPAGIARNFEAQLAEIRAKISARKKVLTNENAEIRSASAELTAQRKELAVHASKHTSIAQFDNAHSVQLKEYAELESRFNRFRTHWMTHNKPVRMQDGTLASKEPKPLKGCPDCQKDFDKFVAGDSGLMKEYQSVAAQMLVDLQRKRAALLPLPVHRADEIRRISAKDPDMSRIASGCEALEQKLLLLFQQDSELQALELQQQQVREKCQAALPPPKSARVTPRSRSRARQPLGLRTASMIRKDNKCVV